MRSTSHDEAMAELYGSDPALALEVINSILADGDQTELLIVLRQMAQVFGGVQAVAEQAHLNPTQLYRTLSPNGNPALNSLSAILKAMGMRLAVQPLAARPMRLERSYKGHETIRSIPRHQHFCRARVQLLLNGACFIRASSQGKRNPAAVAGRH